MNYTILTTPEYTKWFNKLKDNTTKARIITRLDYVARGNLGDHKQLPGDIYELRFTMGSGYRIYYTVDGDTIILLLYGGDKSSQPKDIQKAQDLCKKYKE